uniref:Uncharacterized protein n=1 Tax=Cyprinus carpio carpio TaxID=630221 RepID=A0A8C1H230_CYPCA
MQSEPRRGEGTWRTTPARCIFAIGRPLDEVIQIKIISSTLNCRQSKYRAYISDRQESDAVLCDVQLFSPSGLIENPIKSAATSNTQSCRVFIDAPPAFRIQIRALSVLNNTDAKSTYILIRDVDALKTTIFRGTRLFLWSSSGSRAEVEFHGKYQQIKAASSDGGLKPSVQTPPLWHQENCAHRAHAFTVTLWQSGFKGFGN